MTFSLENPQSPGGPARLRLEGEVTIETAGELKEALLNAFEMKADLLVDCSGAKEVDLSTLQLLCAAHRTARSLGRNMTLDGHSENAFARAVVQAGFPRQRDCLLSPDAKSCLWLPQSAG